MRQVRLPDGTEIPALGQGTWHMGDRRDARRGEIAALRRGIALGMTLIDTAEMYGDGAAEELVGEAVAGQRDRVFIVSKAYPQNAGTRSLPAACERSLRRLGTDRLDLYLLHWRGGIPLAETVAAFARLVEAGKIRRWGVSNLDTDDMEELIAAGGGGCATDQVLYNPGVRGIEFDLLPWCAGRAMPVMAYSPVGQGGKLLRSRALAEIAGRHHATPAQIALAWCLRSPDVFAIPKAADPAHVASNAAAAEITLTKADLAAIDAEFPPPRSKLGLAML